MITPDTVAQVPLFADLPAEQQGLIAAHAADLRLQAGEWLIHEGELPAFFVVLAGRLDVLKRISTSDQVINQYSPGDYSGELPLLLGSTAIASLRASEPSRVLRLDPDDFHELVVHNLDLSAQLLRTMAERAQRLQELSIQTPVARVTVVGHRWDINCHTLREFLSRNHVAFTWVDPDDAAERRGAATPDWTAETYPLVVLEDGRCVVDPSLREIAGHLGLRTAPAAAEYDVAIIGTGPAGLAAGVYGASEGLRTLLIERDAPGGQAGTSSRIENYLGFPSGLSGDELSTRAWQQATRFGAELLVTREVTAIQPGTDAHVVVLDGDEPVRCRAIVLATGVAWRRFDVPGIEALIGRGVYYGAARAEALGVRGQRVVLVGGGNSAGQAAMFFSNYAESVSLLVRGDALQKSMSQYLVDELATRSNIDVELGAQVVAARGEHHLEELTVRSKDGSEATRPADALFILIGADPETAWLPPTIARDELGYVCTGRDMLATSYATYWPTDRDPFLLETSIPGIFAAGDVRHGSVKRVASGVGEGSMSIAFVHEYLATLRP